MPFVTLGRYSAFLVGLSAALVSGCDLISAPSAHGIGDIFVLSEADGMPLPATPGEKLGFIGVVLADTLRFSPYGIVRRSLYIRYPRENDSGARSDTVIHQLATRPYTVDGRYIVIGRDRAGAPNAETATPRGAEHGILTGHDMILLSGYYGLVGAVLRYERHDARWTR